MFHEKLYKYDTMGRLRVWWLESSEDGYRTHSGLDNGQIVISGWQKPTEKNVGRANATTVAEQVLAEVKSKYERQEYQGKYARNIEEAKNGAKFFECMLASKYDPKKTTKFPYWSQPKLDGIRCLVSDAGMQSRNGKPLLSSPHIREALESFFQEYPGVILDGELYNHSMKDDFEKIVSLARKTKPSEDDLAESYQLVEYHVYDVITPDEQLTFEERLNFIRNQVADNFPMVKIVNAVPVHDAETAEEKLGEYLESGYEGQMLRDRDMPYEHKRSKSLIKHKNFEDDEFEIVDIVEGLGNYSGMAKSLIINLGNNTIQSCGMRGKQDYLKFLLDNKEKYIGSDVTVKYQGKTNTGRLRFPVAVLIYEGPRDL